MFFGDAPIPPPMPSASATKSFKKPLLQMFGGSIAALCVTLLPLPSGSTTKAQRERIAIGPLLAFVRAVHSMRRGRSSVVISQNVGAFILDPDLIASTVL